MELLDRAGDAVGEGRDDADRHGREQQPGRDQREQNCAEGTAAGAELTRAQACERAWVRARQQPEQQSSERSEDQQSERQRLKHDRQDLAVAKVGQGKADGAKHIRPTRSERPGAFFVCWSAKAEKEEGEGGWALTARGRATA